MPTAHAYFDQQLANAAAAVDQCMKLGAVIIKPKGIAPTGFVRDQPSAPSPSDRST